MEVNEAQTQIELVNQAFADQNADALLVGLKTLRNLCAHGNLNQETIANHHDFNELLKHIIVESSLNEQPSALQLMALQVMANSIVNNATTQRLIWSQHGTWIISLANKPPLGKTNDILLMIMYNIYQGESGAISDQLAFLTCLQIWQTIITEKCEYNFEFLHFFFEHFLVQSGRTTVRCYSKLNVEDRIAFLNYITNYLRNDSPNGQLSTFLLQYISKEFKIKSDCILKQSAQQSNQLHPREVHTLLRIIAYISGSEKYTEVYTSDHALFLNVSSLLRCLVEASKSPDGGGLPMPMTKLEEVALTSNIPTEFEHDVSFELKTLLVRCTANLLYKNNVNKQYSLDTQLIPALLECTTMDGRNPLMREWSILAIRNACIDCPEIQQIIANLTMQGRAKNDILSELNLELGALRITADKS